MSFYRSRVLDPELVCNTPCDNSVAELLFFSFYFFLFIYFLEQYTIDAAAATAATTTSLLRCVTKLTPQRKFYCIESHPTL